MADAKEFPNLSSLRENAAEALNVSPRHVMVERWKSSPGQRSIRCWGKSLGKSFFAKTLLLDPYPVMPRVALPWYDGGSSNMILRPAAQQIEAEWATSQDLYRQGEKNIAEPLGRSIAAKTIVWRDAGGSRLDDIVKRPRLLEATGSDAAAAMLQAGQWLRQLHDTSASGTTVLDLVAVCQRFRDQIRHDGQESSRHAKSALKALGAACASIGRDTLPVPQALSHGDFMLANLRWNKAVKRLFIVDFENFGSGSLCQDLITIIFDLRSQLVNPIISKKLITSLEKSFWAGYGPLSEEIMHFVNGAASARVFYYHLPQALKKRTDKGGVTAAAASVYKTFLEPAMLARCRGEL